MPIYVEHHNWRRVKGKKKWSDNTVKKFTSLSSFEKYITDILKKYPEEEIKYSIYDSINGTKGTLIACITYSKNKFNVICIDNVWLRICRENNILKNINNKRKTA